MAPSIRPVYAMRRLFGDQLGITASSLERRRAAPVWTSTVQSSLDRAAFCGFSSTFSIVKASCFPSGDQAGL